MGIVIAMLLATGKSPNDIMFSAPGLYPFKTLLIPFSQPTASIKLEPGSSSTSLNSTQFTPHSNDSSEPSLSVATSKHQDDESLPSSTTSPSTRLHNFDPNNITDPVFRSGIKFILPRHEADISATLTQDSPIEELQRTEEE